MIDHVRCPKCEKHIAYDAATEVPKCGNCGWDAETEQEKQESLAYLAGVILGDGWCTKLTLGLRVADEDFALEFHRSVVHVFKGILSCKTDERGYWLVRTSNKTGKFNCLIDYEPITNSEKAAWIRGMFDSEGNAHLAPSNMSANSWNRRAAFYSTNTETLERTASYLSALGMTTKTRHMKASASHIGTKPVYELALRSSRQNYILFADLVGSSIRRKREVLKKIPGSYQPPGHHARAGTKGAASRKARRDAGGKY